MTAIEPALDRTPLSVRRDRALLVDPTAGDFVFEVAEGIFAVRVEEAPVSSRVIEFIVIGDLLTTRMLRGFPSIRLRAIETGTLLRQTHATWLATHRPALVADQVEKAALRAHVSTAIAAMADIDARVATFLYAMALRLHRSKSRPASLVIPFARNDIASHIHVNPDTLSRSYSRLRARGAIEKGSGSRPVILDWSILAGLCPMADLLARAFA